MAISQAKSRRSATGARKRDYRKKKQHEIGGRPILTRIGDKQLKQKRTIGANLKEKLLQTNKINVFDLKTKKAVVATLKNVKDNEANRNFVRRNILTKGTIVETDKGLVKVTSRPGQEGTVNGLMVKE